MIARLRGALLSKSPQAVVVDVGGVGFEVLISLNTFYALPDVGTAVELAIQTQVRENAIELFGFRDLREKALFGALIGVSGVGPRMAIAILSGMPAEELSDAIAQGDVRRLVAVPGVGRKRAERLVVELQDRVRETARAAAPPATPHRPQPIREEAVSALCNLGYRSSDAERAVQKVMKEDRDDLAEVIRAALREVGG